MIPLAWAFVQAIAQHTKETFTFSHTHTHIKYKLKKQLKFKKTPKQYWENQKKRKNKTNRKK
jgi:hypothetical protein